MPYPHVTQFETIDRRRREALALLAQAPRPAPARRRRWPFARRRRVYAAS
jgi:hypothetical protein